MGIYSERKEKESEAERKIRERGSREYEGEARRRRGNGPDQPVGDGWPGPVVFSTTNQRL